MIRRVLGFVFEMFRKRNAYQQSQRRNEPPPPKYATPRTGRSRVDLNEVPSARIRSNSSSIAVGNSKTRAVQPLNRNSLQGSLIHRGRSEERTPARPTLNPGRSLSIGQSRGDLNTDNINRVRSCSSIPSESSQSRLVPLRRSPSQMPHLRRVRSEEMTPAIQKMSRGSETASRLNRGLSRNDTSVSKLFNNTSLSDFRPPTAQESCLSFETCSEAAEDWRLPVDDLVRDLERTTRSNRIFQPRIHHFPQEANTFLPIKCRSRIPVRQASENDWRSNQQRQFRKYTLPTRRKENETKDYQDDDEVIGDCIRPSEMTTTWLVYRNDTMAKFEIVFKAFSKKRHRNSNLIDSATHTNWMHLAGVSVDRDAGMFKQFAGRKVVLTLGEYKSLLDQICSVFDCDYWDVLRKMATCQDEDMR